MRILDPVQEAVWDDLDLFGDNDFEGQTFTLEFLGESEWGNPQPIETWVRAMLLDGSVGRRTGHDVRTPTIYIRVSADTGTALAAGDAALALTGEKQNTTFVWTPPDGDSPPVVFDVLMADVQQATDFDGELRLERVYPVKLTCHPFTRSLVETFEEAVPATGSAVPNTIDNCDSTATWSSPDGTVFLTGSGQAVAVTKTASGLWNLTLVKTASIDLSDTSRPYLRVKWTRPQSDALLLVLASDGNYYEAIASQGGYSWFQLPAAVYTSLQLRSVMSANMHKVTTRTLKIWALERTASVGLGTRRELTRTMGVTGSARTMGRLVVSHPSANLGNVVVYTWDPANLGGYAPSLAPYWTSGGTQTVDASTVSGTREPLNANPLFTIPADALPGGYYRILARIRHTATSLFTVTWQAAAAGISSSGSGKLAMDAANTWQFVTIDAAYLPPVRLTEDSVRDITLELDTVTAGVELDTAWLLHSSGIVTMVKNVTEKSLTIESASPTMEAGGIWAGDHYPGSNSIDAVGQHELAPPLLQMLTITDNTPDATAGLYHFARWRHFPGA